MERKHRHWLVAIIAAHIVLSGLYSAVTPVFEAPDEREHYGYVQHLATQGHLPPRTESALAGHEASQPPLYYSLIALGTAWRSHQPPLEPQKNPFYGNFQAPGTVNDNKNVFLHGDAESFPWRGAVLTFHVARLINLLFGGLTVGATYLLAREVFVNKGQLALYAAAVVAFLPQLLFINSAINNDVAASAVASATLWLLVRGLRRRFSLGRAAKIGVSVGLAAITKASALPLLPFAMFVTGASIWLENNRFPRSRRLRLVAEIWTAILVPALLVAGWWYARNILLYQDLLGVQPHLSAPWSHEDPLDLLGLWNQLPGVALSFFGAFGMGNVHLPAGFYVFAALLTALGAIGVTAWAVRGFCRGESAEPRTQALAALALWLAVVAASLARWMQLVKAALGRLLFPAVGAAAVIFIWGLAQTLSCAFSLATEAAGRRTRLSHSVLTGVIIALFGTATAAPFLTIRPAYSHPDSPSPQEISARTRPSGIEFGGKIRLAGYRLAHRSVRPGEQLSVTFCWEALTQMEQQYAYFVHLLGPGNSMAGSRDTFPGLGSLRTTEWMPGDALCDVIRVPVQPEARTQAVYDIEVGWYEPTSGKRLPAYGADERPVDLVVLGSVKVAADRPQTVSIPNPVHANLGDQVTLLGFDAQGLEVTPGASVQITLYWEAQTSPAQDYTVFLHLAAPDAPPLAQDDGEPRDGTYPTSFWDVGEIVTETRTISIPTELPSGEYPLLAGMYLLDTGERLPVLQPEGDLQEDAVPLGTMIVRSRGS